MAAATFRAWTVAATSWTRKIVAPRRRAARQAARLPPRRSAGSAGAGQLADEPLARRAHQHRPAQGRQLLQPRQQGQVVLQPLAEADAGVDDQTARAARRRPRRRPAARPETPAPRPPRRRSAGRSASSWAARPCASAPSPRPTWAARGNMSGSSRPAEMSLTIVAPAWRAKARHGGAGRVDADQRPQLGDGREDVAQAGDLLVGGRRGRCRGGWTPRPRR